jgi:hypothetical protein
VEQWVDVPGTEYAVSSLGRVRRFRLLKPSLASSGYTKIGFRRGTHWLTRFTHQLVAEAFLGPCPMGKEVNHINGIKSDNRPVNLEYVTRKQNAKNALDRQAYKRKSDHYRSRLKPKQRARIVRLYTEGKFNMPQLAIKFKTSKATVFRLVRNKTWLNY